MLKGGCTTEGMLQDSWGSSVPVEGGIYVTNRERTPKGPGNDDSIDAVLFLPPSSMYPNWVGASSVSTEG